MKKNLPAHSFFINKELRKILLVMKNSILIFLITIAQLSASVTIHGQNLTLMAEGKTVREVFKQIENETNYRFFYNEEFRDLSKSLSFEMREYEIGEVLDIMLANSNVTYRILENDVIVITPLMNNLQQITVTGRVVDALTGEPLPGASIIVRGTTTGTTTGIDGEYSLSVPDRDAVLVFSFVGYATREILVGENNVINIALEEDISLLDEIIVVGYGVQRKSDITGTVASMPRERLDMVPNMNVAQAIQGAVPGIMIRASGGGAEPGQTIMVRGRNSIKASNYPLIIIDGIPYGGSLNDIHPNDVESIEILKDASAAAIYGSRGSNGVILISTKEGAAGDPKVSYEGKFGIADIVKLHRILTGPEFYEFKMTRNPNAMTQSEEQIYLDGTWVDWPSLAIRTGQTHEHTLSVSGGFSNTKYYLGLGFTDIKGVAQNDNFNRLSGRVNVETQVFDWLSIGTRTNLSFDDASGAPANFDFVRTNPLTTAYDEFGRLTVYPWPENIALGNHLAPLLYDDLDKSSQILTNNYLVIDFPFIEGLSYRLNTGYRERFIDRAQYRGRNTTSGHQNLGYATLRNDVGQNTVIENILAYNRDFGNHSIFATALYSYEKDHIHSNRLTARQFSNDFFSWYAVNQAAISLPSTTFYETTLISQMLRLNYAYDSRYLVTLTSRRDGYSGFGSANKWGIFPSIALGWNFGNEKFFPLDNIFNALKLRVSYGLNENQAIGAYESISRLSLATMAAGSDTQIGYKPSRLGLDNLGWESSNTFNMGVDFSIFEGRISGDVNWYHTRTFDLLLDRTISSVHGLTSITQNIGKTQNQGFEFLVSSRNIVRSNFQWITQGNISFNKNKILSLYGILNEDGIEIDDVANKWFIGQPINVIYDFVWVGTWQLDEAEEAAKYGSQPGFVKLKDFDGDGLTSDDRRILGQVDPKVLWGITNTFRYKNIGLSIFVHGISGGMMHNYLWSDAVQGAEVRYGTIKKNWWTPDNPTNDWIMNRELANQMSGFSMNVYEKNDFVRIKDISLSYDLPERLIEQTRLSRLRLYLTGRNLFTFHNTNFLDPEFTSTSHQRSIPLQKEYTIGLNLGF